MREMGDDTMIQRARKLKGIGGKMDEEGRDRRGGTNRQEVFGVSDGVWRSETELRKKKYVKGGRKK